MAQSTPQTSQQSKPGLDATFEARLALTRADYPALDAALLNWGRWAGGSDIGAPLIATSSVWRMPGEDLDGGWGNECALVELAIPVDIAEANKLSTFICRLQTISIKALHYVYIARAPVQDIPRRAKETPERFIEALRFAMTSLSGKI